MIERAKVLVMVDDRMLFDIDGDYIDIGYTVESYIEEQYPDQYDYEGSTEFFDRMKSGFRDGRINVVRSDRIQARLDQIKYQRIFHD